MIRLTALLVFLGLAGAAFAGAAVKEDLMQLPPRYTVVGRADPTTKLRLTVAVKQGNIAALEKRLFEVSDPESPKYGQHLSEEEVNALARPRTEDLDNVVTWLKRECPDLEDLSFSKAQDFVMATVSVAAAEKLLGAEYHVYEHEAGFQLTRTMKYHVPEDLLASIDFIAPTTRFPLAQQVRVNKNGLGVNTPDSLRKLYGVGDYEASQNGLQAVGAFLGQYMSSSDLQSFFQELYPAAAGRKPTIIGPNQEDNPGIEANLDIQYIMSVGSNVRTDFWSEAGNAPGSPENEPFLKWLQAIQAKSGNDLPSVVSVSYGDNEDTVNFDYANRINGEFIKLGARGVSIMFSSGDGGVAGGQTTQCQGGKFIPTFPAGSPYVTAVGGTSAGDDTFAASLSSGGFSNYWDRPSYQKDAVSKYFSEAQHLPDPSHYNQTGAGFPDVAAQAESFLVTWGGVSIPVDGTSCAAPTFSGVVSLLNDYRLKNGKSTLGYLNPVIYKYGNQILNDVTGGHNPGCDTDGFFAAPGWDPVTGYGTPNFEKMKQVLGDL